MTRFVPRDRKHKWRRREITESQNGTSLGNPNEAETIPISKQEKEKRRQELKDTLRSQQPKISSKKQKRLDKYIDNKLKKEENLDLIKKLAIETTDTSLLRSSKTLGVGKKSKRNVLAKALKEEQAKINCENNHNVLYESGDLGEAYSDDSDIPYQELQRPEATAAVSIPGTIGTGLKRPLELGDDGYPVLRKRPRLKLRKMTFIPSSSVPWEGFSAQSDSDGPSQSSSSVTFSTGTQTDSELGTGADNVDISTEEQPATSSNEEDNAEGVNNRKERSSAFRAWAAERVNEALGFTPTAIASISHNVEAQNRIRDRPRSPEHDPLPPELETLSKIPDRKAFSVHVNRSTEIQEARLGLPVVAEEQKIMEAIHNNPAVVIWGATGSGKTTQVPQFLYEAGYGTLDGPTPGMIGVTQPRRVAAVSMAKRVADEMGSASGKVSYQIRFDSTVSQKTAIKYMTDGILIREIAKDFALTKYSAIIIDEAHERSANTDILIGMVSRIVDLRLTMSRSNVEIRPLKLVIMSATLRISDFTNNPNLFRHGSPPLLQAEGRQYPVTVHFARRTQRDYLEEAFVKVSRAHKKLPPGGMLVFLTGQNEITALAKRLKQSLSDIYDTSNGPRVRIGASEAPLEIEDVDIGNDDQVYDSELEGSEESIDERDAGDGREFEIGESPTTSSGVHILPLYSQLPTREQLRVFEPTPDGTRLIVLATNVAETSLTIPGIRYVFDCGRAKEKKYDKNTGVQSFEIGWISKASASQRAGRAGRTGPGHCYRLYSSAIYERDFEEYGEPEILRMPVEGVVLQLKSMDLQHVVNFPFPTPPDRQSLTKAEKLLTYLGAVTTAGQVTDIGRDLSIYPLSPRFSKVLLIGHQHGCMPYTIAMVAALVVPDLFVPESQLDMVVSTREVGGVYTNAARLEDTVREQRKRDFNKAHYLFSKRDLASDALKLLSAVCAYAYADDPEAFCSSMFLRSKALKEASQFRRQLFDIVRLNRPGLLGTFQSRLPEPTEKQLKALKQILAAGFIDQVAIRADLAPTPPEVPGKPKRAIDVPYLTLFPSNAGKPQELDDKAVYIHPSSVLSHLPPKDLPQYIIYSHLQRAIASSVTGAKPPKVRMHALTSISGNALAA
ncbi:MAG: hypothetical protein Q9187_007478, partial [Circinaria calcarea]